MDIPFPLSSDSSCVGSAGSSGGSFSSGSGVSVGSGSGISGIGVSGGGSSVGGGSGRGVVVVANNSIEGGGSVVVVIADPPPDIDSDSDNTTYEQLVTWQANPSLEPSVFTSNQMSLLLQAGIGMRICQVMPNPVMLYLFPQIQHNCFPSRCHSNFGTL